MKTKALLIFTCLAGLAQSIFYYTRLPEKVATHFGTLGLPDGWMTKNGDLFVSSMLFVFITVMMLSTPQLARIIPARFVNLPNKDYWLAEERKEQSFADISRYMSIFGIAINLFFLLINHMVFLANFKRPVKLNENIVLTFLCCFLLFTAGWLFSFYRHFRKPA